MIFLRNALFAAAILATTSATGAFAATYSGSDDGALVGGPFPNSAAAEAAFLVDAAARGTVYTEDFNNQALGHRNLTIPNGIVTLDSEVIGTYYSGVNAVTYGNAHGFDVDSGSGRWLGFPVGSATFAFEVPITSFGFYMTGINAYAGSVFFLAYDGGFLDLPINNDGGVSYFGFSDTAGFTSVTIYRGGRSDSWGVDRVSYGVSDGTGTGGVVPEPAAWALMIMGFAGMGVSLRSARARGLMLA